MNHKSIINDDRAKAKVCLLIDQLAFHPLHEVLIRELKEGRSIAQNRLMWLWITEIGDHEGYSKDEQHYRFKEKFAVPIFVRDDQGYAEMVDAVKAVRRKGMDREADQLKKKIVELTSTTDFNVKQMSEYLNDIEMYALKVGATITFPDDIYSKAMGHELQKQKNT